MNPVSAELSGHRGRIWPAKLCDCLATPARRSVALTVGCCHCLAAGMIATAAGRNACLSCCVFPLLAPCLVPCWYACDHSIFEERIALAAEERYSYAQCESSCGTCTCKNKPEHFPRCAHAQAASLLCSRCSVLSLHCRFRMLLDVPGWWRIVYGGCIWLRQSVHCWADDHWPGSLNHSARSAASLFLNSLQALNALNDEERAALMVGKSIPAFAGMGAEVPHQQTMTAALVDSPSPVLPVP